MHFRLHGKTYCKECEGLTTIQKGFNAKDYKAMIRVMFFIMTIMSIEIAHLYFR